MISDFFKECRKKHTRKPEISDMLVYEQWRVQWREDHLELKVVEPDQFQSCTMERCPFQWCPNFKSRVEMSRQLGPHVFRNFFDLIFQELVSLPPPKDRLDFTYSPRVDHFFTSDPLVKFSQACRQSQKQRSQVAETQSFNQPWKSLF